MAAAALLLTVAQLGAPATGPAIAVTPVAVPRHSAVVVAGKRVADYYRDASAMSSEARNGWSWATYFDGLHQFYRQVGDAKYLDDLGRWGSANRWLPSSTDANPDSVKAGQTYLDVRPLVPEASLAPMDAQMKADLAGLPTGQYSWSDALFMGLPNWPRWAARTGDPAYLDKMQALYVAARDNGITTRHECIGKAPGLYDATEQLWYRDCRFLGQRDSEGHHIFWARGNAWVVAAMAEVLQSLPAEDSRASTYQSMLEAMADRLRQLQGGDGLWRSSLLSPDLYPAGETSSSALIAYALGYGIRAGLLDPSTYLPVVARAWNGLVATALQPSGFLTGCQPVGYQPAASYAGSGPRTPSSSTSPGTLTSDSPPYCVGAFLLAASELSRLTGAMSTGRPVVATAQQVGHEAGQVVDGDVTTRWSAQGFPQSVTVDLGPGQQASNVVVTPYQDRAHHYGVETSTDGVHWTRVVDRTGNMTGGSLADDFSTGTVDLRYVRLTVTGADASTSDWVSIQEFSVHDRYRPQGNDRYRASLRGERRIPPGAPLQGAHGDGRQVRR